MRSLTDRIKEQRKFHRTDGSMCMLCDGECKKSDAINKLESLLSDLKQEAKAIKAKGQKEKYNPRTQCRKCLDCGICGHDIIGGCGCKELAEAQLSLLLKITGLKEEEI